MSRTELKDRTTVIELKKAFGGRTRLRAYRDTSYSQPFRIGGQYETIGAGKTLQEAIADAMVCLIRLNHYHEKE